MLASDVNNPDFMNPQNPDDALFVQFFMHDPVVHRATASTKEQRLGRRIPYVRIARPGDQTTVIVAAVRDSHKIRFPKQWMAFQVREGLLEAPPAIGWKLEEWDEIKDQDQLIHQLHFNRFETVEQIAGAADAQLQNLGIGALGLREKARAAIRARNRSEFDAEMKAKDTEIAEIKKQLAQVMAAMPNATQVKHDSGKQDTLHLPQKEKGK